MLFKGKGYIMHEGKVYEFVDGTLEIEDKVLIEKMKGYYEYLGDCKDGVCEIEVDYEGMTNSELKAILDEKGINYNNKANKNDLIKLIVGVD